MSKKFREYYEMKTVAAGKGTRQVAVYKGDYYRFAVADPVRMHYGIILFILALLNMGFFISDGMLNGAFSRIIYITVPYAIQFLPAMFLISSSFQFLRSKGDMTAPEYISKFRKIKTMGYINFVMSLITAVECALLLILRKISPGINEILFIVFAVIIAIILAIMLYSHKRIENSIEIIKDNQNNISSDSI